ncbi:hypothetical protein [Nocardia terpenica]|uniref:hypothetical protein n=1 Tax=Nocardia terpenica TaxID=455432 RepID=UPI0018E0BABD|nr:hypothetical protein [Nocardia terpenica]
MAVIEVANTVSRAIGYIDDTLPGWPDNEDGVRRYAKGLGYHLVRLLVYSTSTVSDPITRLLDTARACDVAAVITPTLAHIGGIRHLSARCVISKSSTRQPHTRASERRPTP